MANSSIFSRMVSRDAPGFRWRTGIFLQQRRHLVVPLDGVKFAGGCFGSHHTFHVLRLLCLAYFNTMCSDQILRTIKLLNGFTAKILAGCAAGVGGLVKKSMISESVIILGSRVQQNRMMSLQYADDTIKYWETSPFGQFERRILVDRIVDSNLVGGEELLEWGIGIHGRTMVRMVDLDRR